MKGAGHQVGVRRGVTLVEAVTSVLVLALAVPLVFGTMGEAAKSGMASAAETRAAWIVAACLREIEASREGRSAVLPASSAGGEFPPAGDLWVLGFSRDGRMVGRVPKSGYEAGLREMDGMKVRYLARVSAVAEAAGDGRMPMLRLKIGMEYPASAPAGKRAQLGFYSRIQ